MKWNATLVVVYLCVHVIASVVSDFFATLWTVACQAPLSMGFCKQKHWSGLPCPPPGDLPDPGIEPESLTSPALAGRFFTTSATWEAQSPVHSSLIWWVSSKIRLKTKNYWLKFLKSSFMIITIEMTYICPLILVKFIDFCESTNGKRMTSWPFESKPVCSVRKCERLIATGP